VNGDATGGQNVIIRLRVDGSYRSVALNSVLGHNPIPGTWEQVVIPMSRFGVSEGSISVLRVMGTTSSAAPRMLLDDISFDLA
jgi:hypothetical protein